MCMLIEKFSSLTIHKTSWQAHAKCQVCPCWDQSPFPAVALVTQWVPAGFLHIPLSGQASPLLWTWVSRGRISDSIKPLSPGTETQKQLSWCPWGGTPNKGILLPFIAHILPTSLALPPKSLVPAPSLSPSTLLASLSSFALISKGSAIPSSCCVTQYLFLWLESPIFPTLCCLRSWLFMASRLRLPHSLHFNLHFNLISVCKLSYLDQKYSSPTWGIW